MGKWEGRRVGVLPSRGGKMGNGRERGGADGEGEWE